VEVHDPREGESECCGGCDGVYGCNSGSGRGRGGGEGGYSERGGGGVGFFDGFWGDEVVCEGASYSAGEDRVAF